MSVKRITVLHMNKYLIYCQLNDNVWKWACKNKNFTRIQEVMLSSISLTIKNNTLDLNIEHIIAHILTFCDMFHHYLLEENDLIAATSLAISPFTKKEYSHIEDLDDLMTENLAKDITHAYTKEYNISQLSQYKPIMKWDPEP